MHLTKCDASKMSDLGNHELEMIGIADTLRALSDDKSLTLFDMVSFNLSRDIDFVMTKLGITRKQYYSKMNLLINAGLVTRKSGKYFLTSLGKVAYEFHILIGQAVENHWKLKAIDSIDSTIPDNELSTEKRKKLVDTLIENGTIKNILFEYNVALDGSDKFSGPSKVRVISETPAVR